MANIYSGDVGVTISIDTGIDLTDASTTSIYVLRPDGSIVIWLASVTTGSTGLNSALTYDSQIGDLVQVGEYKLQPYIVSSIFSGYGTTAFIQVNPLFS